MIVKNNDSDDKGPGFLGWFPCCFLKYVYYTASRGDPRRQPIHWKGMNVDINGCPSGLISEVFYDSSSNDNLRLEDRQFTAVSSPSIAGTRPRLGDAEIVQVCTVHTRKNKALSLKSGFDEFFVDASLPAASKLSQKSPPVQRPERRRLLDCDFVEIPAAASHLEVDAILKKPPRSRKGKSDKGQTINEEGENSYRIGQHYQAAVHSHLGDEEQAPTECGIDQLWDPQKAANLPALELGKHLLLLLDQDFSASHRLIRHNFALRALPEPIGRA